MCQNANKTAAGLMAAIEPTLKALLSYLDLTSTPDGEAVISAYDAALAAVQNWQSGSTAQNAIQLIGDFQTVFNTLPLPAGVLTLANIILAGIEAVLGVLAANSPAPASPTTATAAPEVTTALYQAHIAAQTEARVAALVPNFRRSIWHSAESQYNRTWNGAVKAGHFPEMLAV